MIDFNINDNRGFRTDMFPDIEIDKRTNTVGFTTNDEVLQFLDGLAETNGIKRSVVIHAILKDYMLRGASDDDSKAVTKTT